MVCLARHHGRAPTIILRLNGVSALKELLADWKLTLGVVAAAVAAVSMVAYAFFRPAIDLAAAEKKRRLHLNQIGRIAEGQVVELVEHPPEPPEVRKGVFGSGEAARGQSSAPSCFLQLRNFWRHLPHGSRHHRTRRANPL